MIDKFLLTGQDKLIFTEIPQKPDEFTNSNFVKMIIPIKYIDYETGVFKLKEFIDSINNEVIQFEYNPKN